LELLPADPFIKSKRSDRHQLETVAIRVLGIDQNVVFYSLGDDSGGNPERHGFGGRSPGTADLLRDGRRHVVIPVWRKLGEGKRGDRGAVIELKGDQPDISRQVRKACLANL
jgi:hypothetical protein